MHIQKSSLQIIQWNLNGFYSRFEDLQLLIDNFQPQIICLHETNFKQQIKNYKTFNKNRNCTHASGGVATLNWFSAINLTLCSPSLTQKITWNTVDDLYDSDHFPIKLTYSLNRRSESYKPPKWKFQEANWELYRE